MSIVLQKEELVSTGEKFIKVYKTVLLLPIKLYCSHHPKKQPLFFCGRYNVLERKQPFSHCLNTGVSGKHGFHSSKVTHVTSSRSSEGLKRRSSRAPSSMSRPSTRPTGSPTHLTPRLNKARRAKVNLEATNLLIAWILRAKKKVRQL